MSIIFTHYWQSARCLYFKRDVIGLSKINRIVDYYAKRPQVQERLTMQIVDALKEALGTKDVACIIDAKHLCVNCRGIKDTVKVLPLPQN